MTERADYAGLNQFIWWHGVVEDINDPLKIGRVRVRILGWHTENKSQFGIPTQDLPWAQVMQPITSPAMSGLGRSPTGVLQGSWVIGFFLDGENAQQPLVMGTYAGIQRPDFIKGMMPGSDGAKLPKSPYPDPTDIRKRKNRLMNPKLGFRDPDGIFPFESRMNEPDTNRLARNENIDMTILAKKKAGLEQRVETALYGAWSEPRSPYGAVYPHNHVVETESGHVFEVDDTPDHERIHTYHRSGTFTEIHPKGSEVHKVVGNAYDITVNDKMILIKGNSATNVNKQMKIRVGKELEIETEGDMRVLVKGNTVMETKGNFLHKIGGQCTIASGGHMTFIAPRIDLNPNGKSAKSIVTIFDKLRTKVKKFFGFKKTTSEDSV